ncbi:PEPxxWA-CTERM sorting domain-containing protein [Phenylobacterium sp.]|uniref:PEPxxWA-CTERM sorting domain-containing protein n=1 Tax=Phenylobacterium sp. TaxID=1871053 RepID=UPI001206BE65|nr:PEPxxWA-CTERM sorting domain-containing protein [Phenylobacterium sp.]THD57887.1 MAG: PEP-CTERM sorting domain-containing protein [Phenylobacterium sp.]
MKLRLLALAASAAVALAAASSASAADYAITTVAGDHVTDPLITDFNSNSSGAITDLAAGYTFNQGPGGLAFTRDGGLGLLSGVSAPPPADNGVSGAFYETVTTGGAATLTAKTPLDYFQFYMGSPDDYNQIEFTFANPALSPLILTGTQIWGGSPDGNGDQSQGFTVSYHFDAPVSSVTFTSTGNSFEFDKLAGSVPEPASWALMILGFGGAGAALRSRRRLVPAAAA